MQIVDLAIPQLSSLKVEEQLAWILAVRERRRYTAKPVKLKKAALSQSKKNALSSMTREQLEKLLERLANG